MEVTYKNTTSDFKSLAWYNQLRGWYWHLVVIVFISYLFLNQLPLEKIVEVTGMHKILVLFLGFLVCALFYIIFIAYGFQSGAKRLEKEGQFKQITLELLDDEFIAKELDSNTHHIWREITDVRHTNKIIQMYISKDCAYTIPKRAFSSQQKAEEFYQFAYDRWQAAKK